MNQRTLSSKLGNEATNLLKNLPVVSAIRASKRDAGVLSFMGHMVYAGIALSCLGYYLGRGALTGEWNVTRQSEAVEAYEKQQEEERKRIQEGKQFYDLTWDTLFVGSEERPALTDLNRDGTVDVVEKMAAWTVMGVDYSSSIGMHNHGGREPMHTHLNYKFIDPTQEQLNKAVESYTSIQ